MRKNVLIAATSFSLLLCGCSKELSVNQKEVSLYTLETHVITCSGTNPVYSSQNPYIASVNERTGKVSANKVGETDININAENGNSTVRIIVMPRYNTYREPCLDWNMTKQGIKKLYGEPDNEDSNNNSLIYLMYQDSPYHICNAYVFDEYNKLAASGAVVSCSFSELKAFLSERYTYGGYSQGTCYFINAPVPESATIGIGVEIQTVADVPAYYVIYLPVNYTKSQGLNTDILTQMTEKLSSLLKKQTCH